MDLLWINVSGAILIALIIYWFWFSKVKAVKASRNAHINSADISEIDIVVENGIYTPARIEIASGESVVLNFLRKDPSPCAEKVVFSGLNISQDLPIDKSIAIQIKNPQSGEHEFTCQMKMYRGTLIVK